MSTEDCTREMLDIEVDTSISALRIVRALEKLGVEGGLPERIIADHDNKFISKKLYHWALKKSVTLHFTSPGKPIKNGDIESFPGRMPERALVHDSGRCKGIR